MVLLDITDILLNITMYIFITYHEFHVTSSTGFSSCRWNLLAKVRGGYNFFSQRDTIVLQVNDLQLVSHDWIVIHNIRNGTNELNDKLGLMISWGSLWNKQTNMCIIMTRDIYICKIAEVTFPPIITVRGTNFPVGLRLILLYIVIIWSALRSCRLYSWIRLTWMSKIEPGLILTPYSVSKNAATLILFSCLTVWILRWKAGSLSHFLSWTSWSKWTVQVSPIF